MLAKCSLLLAAREPGWLATGKFILAILLCPTPGGVGGEGTPGRFRKSCNQRHQSRRRQSGSAVKCHYIAHFFGISVKGCEMGALLERFRSDQCPAQPLPAFSRVGAASATPSTRSAPAPLMGGRCRPQCPWGSSSLPPYQKAAARRLTDLQSPCQPCGRSAVVNALPSGVAAGRLARALRASAAKKASKNIAMLLSFL